MGRWRITGVVPQFGMSTAEVVAHFHWDNQDEDNMLVGLCDMTDTCVISHDVCLLIVGARLQAGMPLPRACIEWAGKMLRKARFPYSSISERERPRAAGGWACSLSNSSSRILGAGDVVSIPSNSQFESRY